MKKILIFCFLLSIYIVNVNCQTDTISENVYIKNGKLGIGTSSPMGSIHIKHPGIEYYNSGLIFENQEQSSIYSVINTWDHYWIGYNEDKVNGYPNSSSQHRFFIHKNGNVGIGIIHPVEKLDVDGSIRATNFIYSDGTVLSGSKWGQNSNNLFYLNGNIGIGTNSPNSKMEVNGMIHSTNEGFKFPDGTVQTTAAYSSPYWSSWYSNKIFTPYNIGIGTENPENRITVIGNFENGPERDFIMLHNQATDNYSETRIKLLTGNDSTNATFIGQTAENYVYPGAENLGHLTTTGKNGLMIRSKSSTGVIRFLTGPTGELFEEKMRISLDGNVGIGTTSPNSKFEVNGLIHSTNEGFKFPDGSIQTTAATSFPSTSYWNSIHPEEINTSNKVGIGRTELGSYFNTKLWVHGGYLQVTDSGYNDAGLVVSHLSKSGYGFARTLHQVYEGVSGDPYTEFRVRNNAEDLTIQSWAVGLDHADGNKFKINSRTNHTTGASPTYGVNMFTILTDGNVGIGTSEPYSKLEVNGMIHSTTEGFKFPDGTVQKTAADSTSTYWNSSLSGKIFTNNKIGIGTSSPMGSIHIVHPGIEYYNSGLIFENQEQTSIYSVINTWDHYWIGYNEDKVNGYPNSSFQHRFFIHKTGNVGIGTVHPSTRLEVSGMIYSNNGGFKFPDGTIQTTASISSESQWNSNSSGEIYTLDKVGIGTSEPKAKVEIKDGDIFISDINKGIIMKSPDGNCWRGTLDNSGNLKFSQINCTDLSEPVDTTTGENIISVEGEINIIPNPFNNSITFSSKDMDITTAKAIIYNVNGKLIKKIDLIKDQVVSTADLPKGHYLVQVLDKNENIICSKKLVKSL